MSSLKEFHKQKMQEVIPPPKERTWNKVQQKLAKQQEERRNKFILFVFLGLITIGLGIFSTILFFPGKSNVKAFKTMPAIRQDEVNSLIAQQQDAWSVTSGQVTDKRNDGFTSQAQVSQQQYTSDNTRDAQNISSVQVTTLSAKGNITEPKPTIDFNNKQTRKTEKQASRQENIAGKESVGHQTEILKKQQQNNSNILSGTSHNPKMTNEVNTNESEGFGEEFTNVGKVEIPEPVHTKVESSLVQNSSIDNSTKTEPVASEKNLTKENNTATSNNSEKQENKEVKAETVQPENKTEPVASETNHGKENNIATSNNSEKQENKEVKAETVQPENKTEPVASETNHAKENNTATSNKSEKQENKEVKAETVQPENKTEPVVSETNNTKGNNAILPNEIKKEETKKPLAKADTAAITPKPQNLDKENKEESNTFYMSIRPEVGLGTSLSFMTTDGKFGIFSHSISAYVAGHLNLSPKLTIFGGIDYSLKWYPKISDLSFMDEPNKVDMKESSHQSAYCLFGGAQYMIGPKFSVNAAVGYFYEYYYTNFSLMASVGAKYYLTDKLFIGLDLKKESSVELGLGLKVGYWFK